MMRYAEWAELTLNPVRVYTMFDDQAYIAPHAELAVIRLYRAGVINGKGSNFDPRGDASRAEVATMLRSFIQRAV
jgi:hypothetical protein